MTIAPEVVKMETSGTARGENYVLNDNIFVSVPVITNSDLLNNIFVMIIRLHLDLQIVRGMNISHLTVTLITVIVE